MGGIEQAKHRYQGRSWENHVKGFFGDLRLAVRRLVKEPRFSLSAILTLALGMGSTTLVFSLVYNLLFQPFVYQTSSAPLLSDRWYFQDRKRGPKTALYP